MKNVIRRYTAFLITGVALVFVVLFSILFGRSAKKQEEESRARMEEAGEATVQVLEAYLSADGTEWNSALRQENETLLSVLRKEGKYAGCAVFIVDSAGEILSASDESLFAGPQMDLFTVRSLLDGASATSFNESDLGGFLKEKTLNYLVLLRKEYTNVGSGTVRSQSVGAIVFSRLSALAPADVVREDLPSFIAVGAAMVLVSAGILFFSRRLSVPLQELGEAAESYAKGDFSRRVPVRGRGEAAALAIAFNDMAAGMEKLEESRSRFLADVAHDLRTPITAISGFAQNMLEGVIPKEKESRYLQIILEESGRLSRLVGTLLSMSKLDAGERRLSFQIFDLAELARQEILKFEKRINEKKIEVEFICPFDRLFVEADPDAIRQVADNLIDNAVKFTPPGGVLRLTLSVKSQKALFSVYNTGEGVPESELPHLFERFYKSDRSRGLDKSGVGLGLFIAKSLIDAHREEIWVTSREGVFTEFVFTLPLSQEKTGSAR